ncbi:MAG: penicillin-binding transpeptidase domain-containing protein [Deltaproteobacteria bacterium]|nr:penicillin-binding transpeptidase domain-containing protein [Deltaproteobacteria bacterium]MCL5276286.1 penicillin-binding transpeptidase domain-containing protein [Deltaproteobacteria bacterium]
MNWRSYQKNHLRSLRRRFRHASLPYILLSTIAVLGFFLYAAVNRTGRARGHPPVSVQRQPASGMTAATVVSPPAGEGQSVIMGPHGRGLPKNIITRWIDHMMDRYEVKYGAVVAIDVKTCRTLAVVSRGAGFSAFDAYPAASLVKLVTASAAIEMHHIPPYASFSYDSRNASQSVKALTNGYNDGRKHITFSMALAKSNNPVFGKLALYKIGNSSLQTYFDRFYFNREVGPAFIMKSSAAVDDDAVDIAQTGAGLNPDITLSPFHAALIVQAIADRGRMCVPYEGFGNSRQGYTQVVSPQTAKELLGMMRLTIVKGTSRGAFFNRRGRYILAGISVAGKTGSIHGSDPDGDYEWFVGIAPVDDPEIAVAAVVVNGRKWTIKGSYLGAQTLLAYFFPGAVKKLLHIR